MATNRPLDWEMDGADVMHIAWLSRHRCYSVTRKPDGWSATHTDYGQEPPKKNLGRGIPVNDAMALCEEHYAATRSKRFKLLAMHT